MESEFLQLAREAVAAMQGPPTWTDVAAVTVGFLQVGLIAWGLRQMGKILQGTQPAARPDGGRPTRAEPNAGGNLG